MALDQSVVNLAKAIRQVETGNRQVQGASGELPSRYQFMPATWKSSASKYLGNANAELTPENENKVAYLKIKEWKDAGYNPGQIASMWNSGSPEWEGKIGVNSAGVKYNVPAYVDKVYAEYKKQKTLNPSAVEIKANTETMPEEPTILSSTPEKKEGLLKSLYRSIAEPVAEVGVSGYNILQGAKKLISGEGAVSALQEMQKPREVPTLGTVKSAITGQETPTEAARKVAGYGLELGTLTAPVGKFKVVGRALKLGSESAGFELGRELEKGEEISPKSIALSGTVGTALPFAGKGVGKLYKTTGNVMSEALGKYTGAGSQAIKEVWENPNVIKFARQAGIEGAESLQQKALNDAKTALNSLKVTAGNEYRTALEKIKQLSATNKDIYITAKNRLGELVSPDNFDISVRRIGNNIEVDFSRSTITEGQNAVKRTIEDVVNWNDYTPAGLDKLKKRLDAFSTQAAYGTPARALIKDVKETLRQQLVKKVKGYEKMTQKYRERMELEEDIEKALSLGDKAQKDTAVRKLMSAMRQNNELRKDMLKTLQSFGKEDITAKIAGASLESFTPRGALGQLGGLGSIAYSISNPASWPLLILATASSSPRLVGELVHLLASAKRITDASGKQIIELTPGLKNIIQRIFGVKEGDEIGGYLKNLKTLKPGLSIEDVSKKKGLISEVKTTPGTSLIQEARKYKSAEEFVKAHGTPVYHGTQAKFNKFDSKFATDAEGRKLNLGWGKGNFYFTTKKGEALKYATRERSPEVTKLYPKGEPNVVEAFVDIKKPFDIEIGKNAERWRKVRDGYFSDGVSDFNYHKIPKGKTKAEAFVEQLKKEGYDGIIDGQEITIFSENSIKTKSQLTDIWNKASKATVKPYRETGDLSTKLLKKLEGRTTVSKQFISDLTNSPDLKQVEKDLIRKKLDEYNGEKIIEISKNLNEKGTKELILYRAPAGTGGIDEIGKTNSVFFDLGYGGYGREIAGDWNVPYNKFKVNLKNPLELNTIEEALYSLYENVPKNLLKALKKDEVDYEVIDRALEKRANELGYDSIIFKNREGASGIEVQVIDKDIINEVIKKQKEFNINNKNTLNLEYLDKVKKLKDDIKSYKSNINYIEKYFRDEIKNPTFIPSENPKDIFSLYYQKNGLEKAVNELNNLKNKEQVNVQEFINSFKSEYNFKKLKNKNLNYNKEFGFTTPRALVKGGLLATGAGLLGSQVFKATPGGGKEEYLGKLPESKDLYKPIGEKKKGISTVYHAEASQTDSTPNTTGFGTKIEFGDVAIGNRKEYDKARSEFIKTGKDTYIVIPELRTIKTPHGYGVFRVRDTMNLRYNGKNKVDIFIPVKGDDNDKTVRKTPNITYQYIEF